ncbi:MAG TPA: hypothetical protein VMB05_14385 [Solirubrobacteraceae bacterium]|nr:hypothetical protein [Solirubrobacteraceae bacterium]
MTGAVAAASLAACGGGTGATAASPSKPPGPTSPDVQLATTDLGHVLVDSRGHTLYLFERDQGTKSTCTRACATAWPPLTTTGRPTAGSGINAALLGTAPRPGGIQVTYNGHPLYRFVEDSRAGETTGQGVTGFGAKWFALSATGDPFTAKPKGSTSQAGRSPSY